MRFKLSSFLLVSFLAGAGCVQSGTPSPNGGDDPTPARGGAGGSRGDGTGGASSGGSTGTGGAAASGGSTGSASGGSGGSGEGSGGSSGTSSGGASGGEPSQGGNAGGDASMPSTDGGGMVADASGQGPDAYMPNVEGAIPLYEGPPIGPEVKMDCPGDPTMGFTEYKDTFKIERPYDLPVSARFNIEGGIYNFMVMQGDKRHNPNSTARNPRTEARFSQNFTSGIRMFSADIYWDKSVNKGSVVMQVHTTTTGIGPVYMVANGNNVNPINASKVPGGLYDRWINLKVEINAQSTGSRYWVNNCLVHTQGSGVRGNGINYFKVGVYHCDVGTCRAKVKNVKLYMK